MLSAFSFSVVAGASGMGTKPNYAQAVRDLGPHEQGRYLVLRESSNPAQRFFNGGAEHVCWISSSQLARVAQRWATGRMSVSYRGRSLDVVTVSGAKEPELRAELGDVSCVLVQVARTFYLPFDAHGS